jgi:hypothetical protein
MSVSALYALTVTTTETLETNVPAASATAKAVTHNGYNSSGTLTATSTVPATQCAYFEKALVAGAATIDLTALTGTNGATVSLSGLKVQLLKIKNKATNANAITVGEGAANGYELAGNAWSMILQPGQEFLFGGNDAAPDVGASAKNIDLAGTGTQAVEVAIVGG